MRSNSVKLAASFNQAQKVWLKWATERGDDMKLTNHEVGHINLVMMKLRTIRDCVNRGDIAEMQQEMEDLADHLHGGGYKSLLSQDFKSLYNSGHSFELVANAEQ